MRQQKKRCHWCGDDPLYQQYHDQEWGVPLHDDLKLFAMLCLEGMQAGLSWITVLRKREHMYRVFADFVPDKLVQFNAEKIAALLQDSGIIKNRLKVNAVVANAQAYLALRSQGVDFAQYLWQFTDNKIIQNQWDKPQAVPTTSVESQHMAKALKKAGFKFVGPIICYAFMQAVGMVNDHLVTCFRFSDFR